MDNLGRSEISRDDPEMAWEDMGQSGIPLDDMVRPGTTLDDMEQPGTSWDDLGRFTSHLKTRRHKLANAKPE